MQSSEYNFSLKPLSFLDVSAKLIYTVSAGNYMLKLTTETVETIETLVPLLLTLNIFHTLL